MNMYFLSSVSISTKRLTKTTSFILALLYWEPVGAQAPAGINIKFDYEQPVKFLEIFDRGELSDDDFEQLMALRASKAYSRKLSTFFEGITDESYRTSIESALADDASQDFPYMIARIVPELGTIGSFIEEIQEREEEIAERTSVMLSAFTPDTINFEATVYLVVGITGGGWTFDDESNAFYIDIRSMKEDMEGMIYLATHELYHLVQQRFFNPSPSQNNGQKLLQSIIDEGSASYVADFSKGNDGGDYMAFNQKVYRTNTRRSQSNFDWFESLLYRIRYDENLTWDTIYGLGLTGEYDSPFYFVGYKMARTLDEYYGRETLLKLLSGPPLDFYSKYAELVSQKKEATSDLPWISEEGERLLNLFE